MNIETLLNERIERLFADLKNDGLEEEQRKAKVDELTKLLDKAAEIERLHVQHDENEIKREQMKDEKKDRRFKNGISIGGIVAPLVVASYWTFISLVYEKDDAQTFTAGKKHLNWLLSLKR